MLQMWRNFKKMNFLNKKSVFSLPIVTSSGLQKGSALVELVVLSIAMIPLMFMVPMLGKLLDLRHTAISASRYVAWEGAMGSATNNTSSSAPVVGSRFFSSPESVVVSHSATSTESSGAMTLDGANPLWGETVESRETDSTAQSFWQVFNFQDSVQSNPESLASTVNDEPLGGVAGTVSDSVHTIASLLDFADGVSWNLQGGDYTTGTIDIEARVGNLLFPVGSQCGLASGGAVGESGSTANSSDSSLCFTESTAILSDTWSVPETEDVEASIESHTRAFVPGVVLEPVGRFLSVIGNLPVAEELGDLEHAFGHVDASQLPAGRSLGVYPE